MASALDEFVGRLMLVRERMLDRYSGGFEDSTLLEMFDLVEGIIEHTGVGGDKISYKMMKNYYSSMKNGNYNFDQFVEGMNNEIKNWLEVHIIPEPNYNSMTNKGGRRKSRRANRKTRKSRRANRKSRRNQRNKRF